MLATCHRPRRRGRGVESDQVALETPVFARLQTRGKVQKARRLLEVVRHNWREIMLVAFMLTGQMAPLNAVGSLFATPLLGPPLRERRRLIMLGCGVMVLYPFGVLRDGSTAACSRCWRWRLFSRDRCTTLQFGPQAGVHRRDVPGVAPLQRNAVVEGVIALVEP